MPPTRKNLVGAIDQVGLCDETKRQQSLLNAPSVFRPGHVELPVPGVRRRHRGARLPPPDRRRERVPQGGMVRAGPHGAAGVREKGVVVHLNRIRSLNQSCSKIMMIFDQMI